MIDKAGENFKPKPIEDSVFYFFKGYLIRVSKNGKDIWIYPMRKSYMSNYYGDKALEKGMEEVYRLRELEVCKLKEKQEQEGKEKEIKEKLKPYMEYIVKELLQ